LLRNSKMIIRIYRQLFLVARASSNSLYASNSNLICFVCIAVFYFVNCSYIVSISFCPVCSEISLCF